MVLLLLFLPHNTQLLSQCSIDSSQTTPGIYPDTLAVGVVNQTYSQDITFVMITDTLGLTISNFQIVSITGLPVGISWQCNNFSNGCNYNPSSSVYGCIGLTGTPLIAGTYNPQVTVVATVQIVGNQTITYSMPLIILPDSSSNPGFSMSASNGCSPLTVNFTNNNPGQAGYYWDFGDGNYSSLENPPAHIYTDTGTFVITQTVTAAGNPQYFLTKIEVTSIPNNYGAPLDVPDLYFLMYDPQNNMIYDSRPAILNTQPPVSWQLPNISLDSGTYRLHFWDEDGGLFGADDDMGEIIFQGWDSSGSASGTVPGSSGTLNVNYTILEIPVATFTASDTVVVYPVPDTPVVTIGGPLSVCSGDSVVLTYNDTLAVQWYLNGQILIGADQPVLVVKNSGDYHLVVTNSFGCTASSSEFSIIVHPKPPKPTFYITGNTFNCPLAGFMLQWYFNGNLLPGETGNTYTAVAAGTYQLTATDSSSGCSTISDSLYFVPVSIHDFNAFDKIQVFPNPAKDIFIVEINSSGENDIILTVFETSGRKAIEQQARLNKGQNRFQINSSNWTKGLYLIRITADRLFTTKQLIIK